MGFRHGVIVPGSSLSVIVVPAFIASRSIAVAVGSALVASEFAIVPLLVLDLCE